MHYYNLEPNKELSRYNHILGYNLIEGFKVGTKCLI